MSASIPLHAGKPPRTLLLVEGYDALTVALTAALQKFAPQYQTQAAGTLAEAEAFAAKEPPDLLIIDVDPPYPDTVSFLLRMKSLAGGARTLVIAAGISAEVLKERGACGVLRFLDKPFGLPEFGAAVLALLQSSAANRGGDILRDLHAVDLVHLLCVTGGSGILELVTPHRRSGEIHVHQGEISHAVTARAQGMRALQQIVNWPRASISFKERLADAPCTIRALWTSALLEALRLGRNEREMITAEASAPQKTRSGKKITIIDDTEMLLLFAEEVLSMMDEDLQITTAATGEAGVALVAEFQPDLVLLDYSLPGIHGDEVCRQLGANAVTSHIPVVMMSGHVLEMSEAAKLHRNIVAAIAKPFFSTALVEIVQAALERGPLPQQGSPEAIEDPPSRAIPEPTVKQSNGKHETPIASLENTKQAAAAPPGILPAMIPAAGPAVPADVVLTLPLELLSVELSPFFALRAIRAKPIANLVSLGLESANFFARLTSETLFEIAATELNATGQLASLRIVPSTESPGAISAKASVANPPMRIQLAAHFDVGAVELSPELEIAAIDLRVLGTTAHASFREDQFPGSSEAPPTVFEISQVITDSASLLQELLLIPAA